MLSLVEASHTSSFINESQIKARKSRALIAFIRTKNYVQLIVPAEHNIYYGIEVQRARVRALKKRIVFTE